jgi:hypothetical protein
MEKHIDTQELAPGKYVSGLIRPWVETPFLFQHFEINDQSDVTDLQWHCQFACLDIERGNPVEYYLDHKSPSGGCLGIDPTAYFLQG